jgi:hypothetical protein
MSKIIITLVLTIFLFGCSSTPNVTFDKNFSHPELPNPVEPYKFNFFVITEDNIDKFAGQDVFVAIEYKQTLEFRKFLEDMKRFMLEANGVICYYREDLQETFCKNQVKYLNRLEK